MATTHSFLLISLGPIQDFIASARRCQDLWFGSWLLSDLSRVVAEHVQGVAGATVIFPAGLAASSAQDQPNPGVANLILAQLPMDADPGGLAKGAQDAMNERLHLVADRAWKGLTDPHFKREVAKAQLDELMEFLWTSVPVTGDYRADRGRVYRQLAAIKNTRLWSQPPWTAQLGAGQPKSSLDGERESVIAEAVFPQRGRPGALDANQRRQAFGLKGMERLCGIGVLKRLGSVLDDPGDVFGPRGRPPFHSTSHIAMVPVIERLEAHPDGPAQARKYLSALRKKGLPTDRLRVAVGGPPTLLGHDGVLLLESRLADHFEQEVEGFAERTVQDQRATLDPIRKALRALLKETGQVGEPCPYYAFLLADGDNMGKAIDAIDSLEGHQKLGGALNEFAQSCRTIVDEHHGTLIFAGGDDVLALLPLHTAVLCARALADRFKAVDDVVGMLLPDAKDRPHPALSVGLGISHCREPMSDARALAKRAETLAKTHPGKNALAIIVAKRSGGDLELVGSWDEDPALDARLAAWHPVMDAEELSAKTAHDLETVAAHYQGLDAATQWARESEILALTRQVLSRKQVRGGDHQDATVIDGLLERVVRSGGGAAAGPTPVDQVHALSAELQVARLLWQARRDAGRVQPPPVEDQDAPIPSSETSS